MQIDPIISSPVITQKAAVGARNQTAITTQADTQPRTDDGEIKLSFSFPSDPSSELEEPRGSPEEAVKVANIALNFSRDEETGSIVAKLVDQTSGETVQQIPSEAVLHLAASLSKLQGQILDTKA